MILYESDEPAWYGTQADAKASSRPFKKREVPTDKPGLLRWLNLNVSCGEPAEQVTETVTPPEANEDWFKQAKVRFKIMSADDVMEWVLDRATNAQVEQLFAALGARFHEGRKS